MTTEPPDLDAVMTLTQWLSPAYPVGAFSYSHGLEWAIDCGDVADQESLRVWIEDVTRFGAGRSDALFLSAAYLAETPEQVTEIDATCRAFAATRERLMETELQGVAFTRTTAAVWGEGLPHLCYPVAVGRAARLHGLPLDLTAAMFVQAFAANLVAAAMRLSLIGQTEGQHVTRALTPVCRQVAEDAAHGDLRQLSSTAFLAEIAAMRHETQYSRIFRT